MKPACRLAARNGAFDEATLEQPDRAELTLLTALRTWPRARCDARPAARHPIAHLQENPRQQALDLASAWLSVPCVSGLLKLIRGFAIDPLDTGFQIRSRERTVSYRY